MEKKDKSTLLPKIQAKKPLKITFNIMQTKDQHLL